MSWTCRRSEHGRARKSPRAHALGAGAVASAAALLVAVVLLTLPLRAAAPHIYAIVGARLVTAAGPVVESGTIVLRDGIVAGVGSSIPVPDGAWVIDGKGLTVYPGLIDMGNGVGLEVPGVAAPQNARTRMELERWKRQSILHPQLEAANYVKADAQEMRRLAAAGVTSVLSLPPGDVVRGRSSLLNVVAPDDPPQIGNVADERRGQYVVKTPVAMHIALEGRATGTGYPESLFGVVAFVRQAFFDAGHYQAEWAFYDRAKSAPRPVYDQALEALQPALAGKLRVAFTANSALEIRRALGLAKEFKLVPMIAGAQDPGEVIDELKAQKVPVIFSLDLPVRSRLLAPDADEPLRVIRARMNAPKVPQQLDRAGIPFAFESAGLRDPADFVLNARKVVAAGLPADVAIRALTTNAAVMAGAGDRLGSLEKGKIANVIVTTGDLFDEKTKVKFVFVDGKLVDTDVAAQPTGRGGRGGR